VSMTARPPRPTREYRIGERVPMPDPPKLDIRPAHREGETKKSLKGAFTNGVRGK